MSQSRPHKEKKTFFETIGKRFEIDADMIRGGERVEIRGRSRVEIGGVKKIGTYTESKVELLLARGTVTVCGCRMECVFYRQGEVAVEGRIDSVSFGD